MRRTKNKWWVYGKDNNNNNKQQPQQQTTTKRYKHKAQLYSREKDGRKNTLYREGHRENTNKYGEKPNWEKPEAMQNQYRREETHKKEHTDKNMKEMKARMIYKNEHQTNQQ